MLRLFGKLFLPCLFVFFPFVTCLPPVPSTIIGDDGLWRLLRKLEGRTVPSLPQRNLGFVALSGVIVAKSAPGEPPTEPGSLHFSVGLLSLESVYEC